jgi:hypothetical protein
MWDFADLVPFKHSGISDRLLQHRRVGAIGGDIEPIAIAPNTFSLLLPFSSGKPRKPVDRLAVCDLTSRHVLQFLTHLEEERGCSARTRNQRLAVIRAFARFVGSRDPAHVEWCGHIRAIASKKSMPQPVGWLTRAEMEAISLCLTAKPRGAAANMRLCYRSSK